MRGDHKDYSVPVNQADAVLDQAAPVSGDKYTVLDTTKNVRIFAISLIVTWTVQPTPLELHITIDGQTQKYSMTNPVSATGYQPKLASGRAAGIMFLDPTDTIISRAFLFEARSIKIEVETTGGTVSNLHCRVKYAKW